MLNIGKNNNAETQKKEQIESIRILIEIKYVFLELGLTIPITSFLATIDECERVWANCVSKC